jgi:hypothetical protein
MALLETSIVQVIVWTLLDVVTHVDDTVLVEDASDDKEAGFTSDC